MLTEKDYCDYDTCVALKELGYNQPSIAFYPCQDIIVDCVDSNGELYEAEYYKGNLVLYSSLNNKNHDINKVQAPLLYEAQKWLREEKKIDVGATWDNDEDNWFSYIKQMGFPDWSGTSVSHSCYSSYEEALSEGIKETIKILMDERI